MTRALDHFVIAVRDLPTAARQYGRLGFQVSGVMRHIEIGTCNCIIQLQGTYLELVGDLPQGIPALRDRMMPRLRCGDGLAIVSLDSTDLEADSLALEREGLRPTPILSARRAVELPDGTSAETDSRCIYAWRPERLYSSLFLTRHHKPEVIWVREYQRHPNRADRVAGITYVCDDPARDVDYVSRMLGHGPQRSGAGSVRFVTPRGETLDYLAPVRLSERFAEEAPPMCPSQPVHGVALELVVADLEACARVFEENAVPCARAGSGLRVSADHCAGVVLEFRGA
jgi:hypothetical protein